METHTMGSNGGTQKPMFDGLSRQGSLYNLTLDEVQQQLGDLGKPFSSMNLDEFLKNVWTAEANQGVNNGSPDYSELTQLASASSLPRQLSLTFTKDLTKKTVYEVWQDIQQDQNKNGSEGNINNGGSYNKCDRQATLGEMTLEDFLVKAGIVAEPCPINQEKQNVDPPDAQWMHYQIPPIQQQQVVMSGHYQVPVAGNSAMQMTMSPTVSEYGRKRVASGDVVEKTVERRQKRMIKNRESAARSRARKQAYTHELENKISRLEEENERLRRQKEVEKVLPSVVAPPPKSKYQLRRTSSALF